MSESFDREIKKGKKVREERNAAQGKDGSFDASSEQHGILRVPEDASQSEQDNQWMRENHNASHALWYLSMIVHAIIHNKRNQITPQKTERILAHMSHLREFIQQTDSRSHVVISRLFDTLVSESPKTHDQWVRFIYLHWNLIYSFAKRYGHQKTCFPEDQYKKVCDIVHGSYLFRWWWWQLRLKSVKREIRSRMNKSGKRGAQDE